MHPDALRKENSRIEATNGLNADEAAIIDVFDDEADFVHMRCQHDAAITLATLPCDDVAQAVYTDIIDQRAQFINDDGADALFAPRDARCFSQAPEQGNVESHENLQIGRYEDITPAQHHCSAGWLGLSSRIGMANLLQDYSMFSIPRHGPGRLATRAVQADHLHSGVCSIL